MKEEEFKKITKELLNTYIKKNSDYGNSFDKSLDSFGPTASAIRLGDKLNRFNTLIYNDAKVKEETVRDTLLDLANYAIMTVMWLDNK